MSSRATWTRTSCIVVLAGLAFVAVSADDRSAEHRNGRPGRSGERLRPVCGRRRASECRDPVALQSSRREQRGCERRRTGPGRSRDRHRGVQRSQLLPPDGTFDLWLIDNQPGPGHTTLAEPGDVLMKVGTYTVVVGEAQSSR